MATEGHSDFMEYYNLQIDFTNTMFVPANTSIFLTLLDGFPVYIEVTGYLGLLQAFMFFVALFATRASEVRSKFYIKVMPEVCYYSSYISCIGLNVVIILTNLICFFTISDKDSSVLPFVVFTILVQLAIAANFWRFLRPHFDYDYQVRSKINRKALDVLDRRMKRRQEDVRTNPQSESN